MRTVSWPGDYDGGGRILMAGRKGECYMYAYDFVAGLVRGGKDPKKGWESRKRF